MSDWTSDIDECTQAADVLFQQKQDAQTAEKQWKITFDAIPDPIALIDTGHRIMRVNRAMADLLQRPAEDVVGRHCYELVHGTTEPPPFCPHTRMLATGDTAHAEIVEERLGGVFEITTTPFTDPEGKIAGSVHIARNITLQHQANTEREAALATLRAITDSANDAVIMMGPQGDISFWNPAAEKMFGYHSNEVLGKNVHALLAPEEYRQAYETAFPHFQRTGQGSAIGRTLDLKALKKGGRQVFIELSLSALERPDGWHAVGIVRDITERKRTEAKLSLMATTDDLTGTWNRRYFMNAMVQEIERARRHGHPFSVLMLDIDHFKAVNDNFGHAAGDAVLKHLVSQITGVLRQTDITGRLGGEEFGMLLPETHLDGAVQLAERVRSTIEKSPVHHGGRDIFYTVSIGVAVYRQGADSVDTLLQQADNALYAAKEGGRNRVVEIER